MGLFDIFKKKDKNFEEGRQLVSEGQYLEGVEAFKRVQPDSSYYEQALAEIVSYLNMAERHKEAPQWFDKLPESSKHYQQAVSNMIAVYLHLDRYEDAINLFRKKAVMEKNPYYGIAVVNYVVTLDWMEKYEENVDKCDELIETFDKIPTNLYTYETAVNFFLDLLTKFNKYEAMLKYSEKVLKINPYYNLAIYHKGEALYELGRYEEALEVLDGVDGHSDDCVDALYVKGLIYGKMGEKEEAEECFEAVYSIEHSSASAVVTSPNGERQTISHHGRAPKKRKD